MTRTNREQQGENTVTSVTEGYDEAGDLSPADDGHEPTGNATVDAVLESLERLEGAPVSDHIAVFEAAHEKLRGALADAGSDQPAS